MIQVWLFLGKKEILHWVKNYPIYDFFEQHSGEFDKYSDSFDLKRETIELLIESLKSSLKELESGNKDIYFYQHTKDNFNLDIEILQESLDKQIRKGTYFHYRYTT